MKPQYFILSVALFLSACSGTHDAAVSRELSFKCADGNLYVTSIYQDKNQAELMELTLPEGRRVTLINVVAASGARYVGSTYEWWNKGNDAILSNAGTTLNCSLVKAGN